MKKVILGHLKPDVDSILSGILLETILNKDNNNYKYIIPDEKIDLDTFNIIKSLGIDISYYQNIPIESNDELILVDHNEETRFNNPIIAIYDHHPDISNRKDTKIKYLNRQSCSTTTIIAQEYFKYMTKETITLALIGALVDTASFHSSKTNKEEEIWLKEKCQEFGIDFDKYYDIGLCLTDISNPHDIYLNGLKKYTEGKYKIESSYIQINNIESNQKAINEIIKYIKKYIDNNEIDIFVFIVQEMDTFTTTTYTIDKDSIIKKRYSEYTSRGNTIIPELRNYLKKITNFN